MEQEIITPEKQPATGKHGVGMLGCVLAAAGATLSTFFLFGSASAAAVWAFSKLFGFNDIVLYVLMVLSFVPVLWATVWTAGRAWHVERRLEAGLDVDVPVFALTHYWRR